MLTAIAVLRLAGANSPVCPAFLTTSRQAMRVDTPRRPLRTGDARADAEAPVTIRISKGRRRTPAIAASVRATGVARALER
jgi:hypothetical protein